MKRAGMSFIFPENKVVFADGIYEKLEFLSTGHVALDIFPKVSVSALTLFTDSKLNDECAITKLHVQFGHCRAEKLSALLKNAGYSNKERSKLIEKVCSSCDVGCQFGRVKARPVVGLPNATEFKQTIAIDLHFLVELGRNVYYLHIIDVFTKYSVAVMIYDKQS